MKKGFYVFLILILLIPTIIFFWAKIEKTITNYKNQTLGIQTNYNQLQKEYKTLRENTKNLKQVTVVTNSKDSKNTAVADTVDKGIKIIDGAISVYYKNLTTNESVVINGDQTYYMASLYKVILTLFILDKVQAKETTLDEKISLNGSTSATLATALDKIITESNNEYAQNLAENYGWETIETAMSEKLGLSFHFDKNLSTTVINIGTLFEDIALSLTVKDSESKYLLHLLGDQTKLSKLPKYLPKNVLSHNKTGEYEEYSHDAGIFYTPKANYILVVMTKTKNPGDTNEEMAKMSKEIYEALNN